MTRSQLEAVHDMLAELIGSWNNAAAREDRGPPNNAIVLTVSDDGSGSIGRRRSGEDTVEDFHAFRDVDELVKVLEECEYVEIDEG
jgi:hypothetical protein